MGLNLADRRRVTVATLITVAALPALWLMQRDADGPGTAGVAAAGASGGIAIAAGPEGSTTIAEPATSADPAVTTAPAVVLVTDPPVDRVVSSTIPADRRLLGTATYKRYSGYPVANPCLAPRAPVNAEITVRSRDTGRTITCFNVVSYAAQADPNVVVVVNTDTFLQMADTVDAPAPVEITW